MFVFCHVGIIVTVEWALSTDAWHNMDPFYQLGTRSGQSYYMRCKGCVTIGSVLPDFFLNLNLHDFYIHSTLLHFATHVGFSRRSSHERRH